MYERRRTLHTQGLPDLGFASFLVYYYFFFPLCPPSLLFLCIVENGRTDESLFTREGTN